MGIEDNPNRPPAGDSRQNTSAGTPDGARGMMRVVDLARTWHTFRATVAVVAIVLGLQFGLMWQWPGGLLVAGLAALALPDAIRRRLNPTGSPTPIMLLDAALIGAAMIVIGLEPAGVWAPLLYMFAIPVLLLPWRRAVPVIIYSAGWAAVAFVGFDVLQPGRPVPQGVITAIVTMLFGGLTLVLLGIVAHQLERAHRAHEQRITYERALVRCGQALLASTEERSIDAALEALLEAVPAQNIFVDRNFLDPDLGICARVTHEIIRPGFEDLVDEEIWMEPEAPETISRTVLPYSDLPTSYAALVAGKAAVMITSQLTGTEREIYEEDGCKSELNIPINVMGEWVGSIGIADYVTERQWSEDDLQILYTTGAMIGAFWERNRAYAELEEMIRSKDEFLASISHEIRTPLTAVLGFSTLLHQDSAALHRDAAAHVALIAEEAQEVSDIVEDLLVAARADIDSLSVIQQPVELRRETERVLAARAGQSGHQVYIEGEGHHAWADPTRVRQIIRCLVSNAVRYGGDRIEIHIRRVDDRARLAVLDNGDGVPAEHLGHVFDAFHRAHSRDGRPQAIGLGLYVARHLARLMGGELTHRQGQGLTAFELDLPTPAEPAAPSTAHEESLRQL
jgi:signal transduction histidine kinase